MPAHDDSSAQSRRQSWSARFSTEEEQLIERGCALTHCGVASRFIERAFLDYAAAQGFIPVTKAAPVVIADTPEKTLENIILVQDALVARLLRKQMRPSSRSSLIARQATLSWISHYLITGSARPEELPPTPLSRPLPIPLNIRMLPLHLDLLTEMGARDGMKTVLAIAIRSQAENLHLDDEDYVDEWGLPRHWARYPHPELLATTNTIEDTMMALIVAYRSLEPVTQTMTWVKSATALMSEIPRIKLSKMVDE